MAALRGNSSSTISPKILRLDGNTGKSILKSWNSETKQREDKPFSTPFLGTIILYKYFVQWKYGTTPEGANVMSREFSSFKDEQIELLKIDYNQNNKTEVIGTWDNYSAFKKAKEKTDDVTGKESYPFDFWCTLYIYVEELGEVVRLKFKGDSRKEWFDYNSDFRRDMEDVEDICEITTSFGSVKAEMAKSANQTEAKFYYRASFDTVRLNTPEEMNSIMVATRFLIKWMNSFEKTVKVDEEADEIIPPVEYVPTLARPEYGEVPDDQIPRSPCLSKL